MTSEEEFIHGERLRGGKLWQRCDRLRPHPPPPRPEPEPRRVDLTIYNLGYEGPPRPESTPGLMHEVLPPETAWQAV